MTTKYRYYDTSGKGEHLYSKYEAEKRAAKGHNIMKIDTEGKLKGYIRLSKNARQKIIQNM